MQTSTKIRTATLQDLPIIQEIMNEAIEKTTAIYDYVPKDEQFIKQWFQERMENNYPVLIAEYGNEVAGYGTYFQFRPKEGFKFTAEHSIYIKEIFWARGMGTKLLQALILFAASNNMHSLIAGIDAENEISIRIHEKLGFQQAGVIKEAAHKFNKWLDLVYYQLLLK